MLSVISKSSTLFKSSCSFFGAKNVRLSSHFTYEADAEAPVSGPTTKMNMFQAINNALDLALKEDDSAVIFGEDVGFGGVFRCSLNLQVSQTNFEHSNIVIRIFSHNGIALFIEKIWKRSCIQYATMRTRDRWFWCWNRKCRRYSNSRNSIC